MTNKLAFNCSNCKTKVQLLVTEGMYDSKKMVRCSSCQEVNTIKIPSEHIFLAKKKKNTTRTEDAKTFISETSNSEEKVHFSILENEFSPAQNFILTDERMTVGRKNNGGPEKKPDIEIVSKDGFMSKLHCELKKVGDNFTISDFNSANGTWVNGGKLADTDVLFLENRDKIKLGRTEIVISIK